ncbi:lysozyme [Limnobacter humi]|uniref:Lysozyme n=1 Tax=Limnobacter humi TaxID=1778671 RepID=A0ABT1WKQ4_9BURK|nr:lysozyme [Limnobacter humi]MCQ8897683.1 lysozyme [Limnobacter humi]
MKLGIKGKALIQEFERFSATLYDSDGAGHCTIGWGHLVHRGFCDGRENESVFRKGISKSRADQLFMVDVEDAEAFVNKILKSRGLSVNQAQFDALVSFTYNVGSGNFKLMMDRCFERFPDQPLDSIPQCMQTYNKAGSRVLQGLVNRRKKEIELFMNRD